MGVGAGRLTLKENIYVRKGDQPGMADDNLKRSVKIEVGDIPEEITRALSRATISHDDEEMYKDVSLDDGKMVENYDDEVEDLEKNIEDIDGSIDNMCEIQVSVELIKRIFETPSISQATKKRMIDLCDEIYGRLQGEINHLEDLVDQYKLQIEELRKL